MQAEEISIVKSIIYGNPIQTSYGMFRSLCSAINHKDHIDKIIFYLRNNPNFKKYNKFVYAFRLEPSANQDTFITQDRSKQKDLDREIEREKFIDGYNDDTGLQGNGEKLLNLLKKFNVRNVLVIVAIRQKDPLRDFHSENYVQVVKCAKDLLSSLYDKVVQSKESIPISEEEEGVSLYQAIPAREFAIPIVPFTAPQKKQPNINYVGQEHIRKVEPPSNKKLISEMEYLNSKIEELANKLEDVIEDFVDVEDSQVEFVIRYDKSKDVGRVLGLLAQLFGLTSKDQIIDQMKEQKGPSRMSNFLRSITMHSITSEKIRSLNQQMMSNLRLRENAIKKENPICGMLMRFIQILLKSYSFARRLALIQSEMEDEDAIESPTDKLPGLNSQSLGEKP